MIVVLGFLFLSVWCVVLMIQVRYLSMQNAMLDSEVRRDRINFKARLDLLESRVYERPRE